MWVQSTGAACETGVFLQVPCTSLSGVPSNQHHDGGPSASGEAWGLGVPPRHCRARQEARNAEERRAEEKSRGPAVKQRLCGSHAITQQARPTAMP